jgi:hypothetical protein
VQGVENVGCHVPLEISRGKRLIARPLAHDHGSVEYLQASGPDQKIECQRLKV